MNKNKALLKYTIALIVVYYLLPFIFKGSIASILLINPITVLVCSILYSKNKGFNLFIVLIAALFFLPSIFIFYNESAWIYTIIYAIISLAGSFIGSLKNKG